MKKIHATLLLALLPAAHNAVGDYTEVVSIKKPFSDKAAEKKCKEKCASRKKKFISFKKSKLAPADVSLQSISCTCSGSK